MVGKSNLRTKRISDLIAREIALILRTKASNKRFSLLTITGAKVSRDLRVAHVYVSILGDGTEAQKVKEDLAKAAGFFRGEIGRRLKLRFTPEIRFVHDVTVEKAHRIIERIDALEDHPNTEER
jgi:ribosome-binding factor A